MLLKYIGVAVVSIAVIFVVWYVGEQYKINQNMRNNISVLDGSINSVTTDELRELVQYLGGYMVYFHDMDDLTTIDTDRAMLRVVNRHDLQDVMVMVNISHEPDLIEFLNEFKINMDAPMLIYFKDNEVIDILGKDDKRLSYREITNFLRKYTFIER